MRFIYVFVVFATFATAQCKLSLPKSFVDSYDADVNEYTTEGYLCDSMCDYNGKPYLNCFSNHGPVKYTESYNCTVAFNDSPCYTSATIQHTECNFPNSSLAYDSAWYAKPGSRACCFAYRPGGPIPVATQSPGGPVTCAGIPQTTCKYRLRNCVNGYVSDPTSDCTCEPGFQGDRCQYFCFGAPSNPVCCNKQNTETMADYTCKCKVPFYGRDCGQSGCLISDLPNIKSNVDAQLVTFDTDPYDAVYRTNKTVLSGDYFTYKCWDGSKLYGPSSLTCKSGVWTEPDGLPIVPGPNCLSHNEAAMNLPSLPVLIIALIAGLFTM